MAENTKISWTTHTHNWWWGCSDAGPGCLHCYAEAADKRYGGDHWGSSKPRRKIKDISGPDRWQREAEKTGVRPWVFAESMGDIFDKEVPSAWREEAWDQVRRTPLLNWQFCTKRIGNAEKMMPDDWSENFRHCGVMLTVVMQDEFDRDVPKLSRLKEVRRVSWVGLSMEPLLEQVTLVKRVDYNNGGREAWDFLAGTWAASQGDKRRSGTMAKVDWVITGGESGPRSRPANPAWFRSLRDQCAAADIPFHFKQHGSYCDVAAPEGFVPDDGRSDPQTHTFDDGMTVIHVGVNVAGRLLDGRIHDAMPAFQFPSGRLL